jgi:hypothetical protein
VRLLHAPSRVDASFDEPNLVSAAGLVPVLRLAAGRRHAPKKPRMTCAGIRPFRTASQFKSHAWNECRSSEPCR